MENSLITPNIFPRIQGTGSYTEEFNPLNAELNPICHLLALLGAHHILHVSRVRVNIGPLIFFFCDAAAPPTQARASSFTRFPDHTQRRITVDRTPLDE